MSVGTSAKPLRAHFSPSPVPGEPAWLAARREEGWRAFERLCEDPSASGTRWLEEIRGASRWELDPGPALGLPELSLQSSDWGELSGAFGFGIREQGAALLSEEARRAGVVFCGLREALRDHEELLRRHLFSRTPPAETAWTALNAARFGQGTFLFIPKGVRLQKPFRSLAVHTGGEAGLFPRTLVVLEEGAEATFVEETRSAGEAPGLCSAVTELVLGEGAQLNYVGHQELNRQSLFLSRQSTALSRNSYLYTLGLSVGARWSTAFIGSRLEGEGAKVDLLGLVLCGGERKAEIRTLQDHVARSCESDALVKSILRDRARFYFDGVVKIYKSGQNSNAFQSNPNLLLSSQAKAESVPTLEIEADDVSCKHAASIGSIDEEERFYLLSRGVPERETEALIVEGFATELAARLPNELLQERFAGMLNRLAAGLANEDKPKGGN